jgi:hypothetical protein
LWACSKRTPNSTGTHEEVFRRAARGSSGLSYFLDFADREGRIIEIRPDGWELAAAPPVFFRRAVGQLALPLPEQGGSLEILKEYVNVRGSQLAAFDCGPKDRAEGQGPRALQRDPLPGPRDRHCNVTISPACGLGAVR